MGWQKRVARQECGQAGRVRVRAGVNIGQGPAPGAAHEKTSAFSL